MHDEAQMLFGGTGASGYGKFGGKAAEPFLVVLRQHMGARSTSEPLPTLTPVCRRVPRHPPLLSHPHMRRHLQRLQRL